MNFLKYCFSFVCGSLLVLGCIAAVNWQIDSENRFLFEESAMLLADILAHGDTAVVSAPYDERLATKLYSENWQSDAQVAIFGSSRSRVITPDIVGEELLNFSVSGASLEDIVALVQIAISNFPNLNKIIFSVDPWVFNEKRGDLRFGSIYSEYVALMDKLQLEVKAAPPRTSRFAEMISLEYFFINLKHYIKKRTDIGAVRKTVRIFSDEEFLIDNEYLVFPGGWVGTQNIAKGRTVSDVEQIAMVQSKKTPYGFENYDELAQRRLQLFDKLVVYLLDKGISVQIYLLPFHPTYYKHLNLQWTEKFDSVASAVGEIAEILALSVIGSYQSQLCQRSEFDDEIHPRISCLQKVISSSNNVTRSK